MLSPNYPNIPIFSIIICTYQRPDFIKGVLESLVQQTFDPELFEVIIVDNGPSDETAAVVRFYQANFQSHTIIYLIESQPGSGRARYKGFQNARANWIGFTDDDAKVRSDWLEKASEIISSQSESDLDGFGGPFYPFYPNGKPTWYKDEYEIRSWGNTPRFLRNDEAFAGPNMFFNKPALECVIGASIEGGMIKDKASFGEDTVLFEKLWMLRTGGARLFYHPDLVVYHAAQAYKLRVKYMIGRQFLIGRANYLRWAPDKLTGRWKLVFKSLYSMLRLLIVSFVKVFRYRTWENWVIDCIGPVAKKLGMVMAMLGIKWELFRE